MKKVLIITLVIFSLITLPVLADTVVYNLKTGKYHSPNCTWAKKCTVNCIRIDRKELPKYSAVPCKVCGGR